MSLRQAFTTASSALAGSSSAAVRSYTRPLTVLGKRSLTSLPTRISDPSKSNSNSRPVPCSTSQTAVRSFASSQRALAGGDGSSSDAAPGINITELTTSQYEEISETDMEILNESLEYLCEDLGHGNWEVEYSSGVLNLSLPPHGHYVVNKQPPNQQIWISSPLSGPSRFGYSSTGDGEGVWVHHRREGVTLGGLLNKELKEIMEKSSISGGWEGTGLK